MASYNIFDDDPFNLQASGLPTASTGVRGAGVEGNRGTTQPTVSPYSQPNDGLPSFTPGLPNTGNVGAVAGFNPAPQFPAVLPGWDATKWANPEHTTPKYDIGRMLAGYDATPAGLQRALAAIQAKYPGTQLVGLDKLQIPGVGLIDVLQGANIGGTGWWWGAETDANGQPLTGGGSGAGGAGAQGSGGSPSGWGSLDGSSLASLFSDPAGRTAMDAVIRQLAMLTGQPPEAVTSLLGTLTGRVGEAMPENAQLNQFLDQTRTRIGQLQGDPFSDPEEAALRAAAYDQIERDRTTAKQQLLEQLGARGHSPTDGVVVRALQELDQSFDSLRAQQTNALMMYQTTERQNRLNQAQGLSGLLEQVGRAQQGFAGSWSQQDFARAMQALAAQTGLWDQQVGYGNQAVATSLIPEQILQGRFNMLSGAAGNSNPMSAIGGYTGLASLIQQQQAQRNAYWANLLGSVAQSLSGLFG